MSRRMVVKAVSAVFCLMLAGGGPATAAEVTKTYDFALDQWLELDATDGPVTLHRVRLDRKEGRVTKSVINRPINHAHLETIGVQLEYTNNADRSWRARIEARWFDDEGELIDGLSVNETLKKKSASKIEEATLSTLKYGLARARTLEITIRYEP